MSQPLAGVRVLDLTRVIAGPYCTQLLADLGADVVKIEPPEGDLTRSVGPQRHQGMSANFLIFNAGKRSAVLDLKQPDGRSALLDLVAGADVFVVNFRPSALERLAITYEDLRAVNRRLVYCRIVGFPTSSAARDQPAIDDVVQAATGLVDLQERVTGAHRYVGLPLADLGAGLFAVSGILAALFERTRTGEGGEVEVAMYDAVAQLVLSPHLSGSVFDPPLAPPVYPRSVAPDKGPFRTLDGWICVSPFSDRDWRRFFAAVGRSDVLNDPRFATPVERSANLNALYQVMAPILRERSTEEWLALLGEVDVPAGAVSSVADLIDDPGLLAAGVLREVDHPTEGRLRLVGSPIRFAGAVAPRRPPPQLGEHTDEILAERTRRTP